MKISHHHSLAGLIVWLSLTGCATQSTAQDGIMLSPLQPEDSVLVEAAVAMVQAAPEVSRVWPGFWPEDQAFLLLRPVETAILITPRSAPSEYMPLPEEAVPNVLHGVAFLRSEYPPEFDERTFSARHPVGQDTIPALEPKGSTPFNRLDFYYHEAFHGHQREYWAETPGDTVTAGFQEPLVNPSHIESPEFEAMGEVERRLLDAALDASSLDSLRALMRPYLAVRRQRSESLADVKAVERRMERREGTAQYFGCQAATLATDSAPHRVVECIREELNKPLDEFGSFPESDARLMRWRQYGTGAALSLVLDRLDPDWKQQVERGEHLDDLVAEAVAYDPDRDEALADQAFNRFGYERFLGAARE